MGKDFNGNKIYKEKYRLLWTLKEIVATYNAEILDEDKILYQDVQTTMCR